MYARYIFWASLFSAIGFSAELKCQSDLLSRYENGFFYTDQQLTRLKEIHQGFMADFRNRPTSVLYAIPQAEGVVICMKGTPEDHMGVLKQIARSVHYFDFKKQYAHLITGIRNELFIADNKGTGKKISVFSAVDTGSEPKGEYSFANLDISKFSQGYSLAEWPRVNLYEVIPYRKDSTWAVAYLRSNLFHPPLPTVERISDYRLYANYTLTGLGNGIMADAWWRMSYLTGRSDFWRERDSILTQFAVDSRTYATDGDYLNFIRLQWLFTMHDFPVRKDSNVLIGNFDEAFKAMKRIGISTDSLLAGSFFSFREGSDITSNYEQFCKALKLQPTNEMLEKMILSIIDDSEVDTYNRMRFSYVYFAMLWNCSPYSALKEEKLVALKKAASCSDTCYPASLYELIMGFKFKRSERSYGPQM